MFRALLYCFLAIAFGVSALLTFVVSLFGAMGWQFPLTGPLALVSEADFLLLGWGQLAIALGLMLASRQAYYRDLKDETDGKRR